MNIKMSLSVSSIEKAIKELETYKAGLERKAKEICKRLAAIGVDIAKASYDATDYDGTKDVSVTVEPTEYGCRILANGASVLFLEFGSGARYGGGHPLNSEFGMGPGTWSDGPNGKGHWDDPNGWYLPKSAGQGRSQKSYGNYPAMGMYEAAKEMRNQIAAIAREVFASD